jgi:hypothetical protein
LAPFETRFGTRVSNVKVDIPINSPQTPETVEYMWGFTKAHYDELMRAVFQEKTAEPMEPQEVMVDGRKILCKRWRYHFADYGEVVYWYGRISP